jgi:hypothetical protein
VLIVEDEFLTAIELEAIVRNAGAEVIGPALSAPQALLLIDNHKITVAILDVWLNRDTLRVSYRGRARHPFSRRLAARPGAQEAGPCPHHHSRAGRGGKALTLRLSHWLFRAGA